MLTWLRKLASGFSALTGRGRGALDAVFRSRVGDPPVRGTREFLEVYETSPWVRAVAGKTAGCVGATQWTLQTAKGKEIRDHVFLQAMRRPNPLMSGHQLVKFSQLCLDIVGDSFWLKVRNGLGAPVEFYPIPPHWIAELPTPGNPSYRMSYYGWQERIADTEIFWAHDAAPADPYRRGSGLVRAQADELETAEYASKHAKQLFWNRAIPEFVVMPESGESLAEDEMARGEKAFAQKLQGFWRWYKPYFSNKKLEFWQPQQMNLENLTMVPLMKYERDTIIQAWGFPPEQLGIVENSNRATIDGSDYIFESRIVRPRREFLRDCIQAQLIPEYDERLVVGFVDTVPEDKEYQLSVMKAAPWNWTRDEWRQAAGSAPAMDGPGNERVIPMNYALAAIPWDVKTKADVAGILVRAGYDPADAATVAGLPAMKHTGLPPVTVQGEDAGTVLPFGEGDKPVEDTPAPKPPKKLHLIGQ